MRWAAEAVLLVAAVALLAFTHRDGTAKESGNKAGVTVADRVLVQGAPFYENGKLSGWSGSPSFLISPGDTAAAVDGVVAAAKRFAFINEDGHEIAEADLDGHEYNTPSWVGAFHSAAGLVLVTDTSGDLPRLQGETMIAILTEELRARGVTARIEAMPRRLKLGEEISF
jgi:hypothetical protein